MSIQHQKHIQHQKQMAQQVYKLALEWLDAVPAEMKMSDAAEVENAFEAALAKWKSQLRLGDGEKALELILACFEDLMAKEEAIAAAGPNVVPLRPE